MFLLLEHHTFYLVVDVCEGTDFYILIFTNTLDSFINCIRFSVLLDFSRYIVSSANNDTFTFSSCLPVFSFCWPIVVGRISPTVISSGGEVHSLVWPLTGVSFPLMCSHWA